MSNPFVGLNEEGNTGFIGEEVSPYMMVGLGVQYPQFSIDTIMSRAKEAHAEWSKIDVEKRADLLIDMLDAVSKRFFELGLRHHAHDRTKFCHVIPSEWTSCK